MLRDILIELIRPPTAADIAALEQLDVEVVRAFKAPYIAARATDQQIQAIKRLPWVKDILLDYEMGAL